MHQVTILLAACARVFYSAFTWRTTRIFTALACIFLILLLSSKFLNRHNSKNLANLSEEPSDLTESFASARASPLAIFQSPTAALPKLPDAAGRREEVNIAHSGHGTPQFDPARDLLNLSHQPGAGFNSDRKFSASFQKNIFSQIGSDIKVGDKIVLSLGSSLDIRGTALFFSREAPRSFALDIEETIPGGKLHLEFDDRGAIKFGTILSPPELYSYRVIGQDPATFEITAIEHHDILPHEPPPGAPAPNTLGLISSATSQLTVQNESVPISPLQSRAGAPAVLYLDFDGETLENTAWNTFFLGPEATFLPPAQLSEEFIYEVWHSTAELFKPFNINVTTVKSIYSAADPARRGQVVFTDRPCITDEFVTACGGRAFMQSWGTSTPGLVFPEVGSYPWNHAVGAAHEAGHMLSLGHDGVHADSGKAEEYFFGNYWGPIMGGANAQYENRVAQWNNGSYQWANNQEDDLSLIAFNSGGGYAPDLEPDFGHCARDITPSSGTTITIDGSIEAFSDEDWFLFNKPDAEPMSINVRGSLDGYGALDVTLGLYDAGGPLIRELAPTLDTGGSAEVEFLPAGNYLIRIIGGGEPEVLSEDQTRQISTGFNRYGSLGSYSVEVAFASEVIQDRTPLPDPECNETIEITDECPHDENKIAPGICGCGVSDADSDFDGMADCEDECPTTSFVYQPGNCGCDGDIDLDGSCDIQDQCPNDPQKNSPGICGCGESDVDSDSDGVADCIDICPDDPSKTVQDLCGCGTPDDDSDLDGTIDCFDSCPRDPLNTLPELCGCGDNTCDIYEDRDVCPQDCDTCGDGQCDSGEDSFNCLTDCPEIIEDQPDESCYHDEANAPACQRDLALPYSNPNFSGAQFDTKIFLDRVEEKLEGAMGYQIAVSSHDQVLGLRHGGLAGRTTTEDIEMSNCHRLTTMSQTKILTAAAVLRLLHENGLTDAEYVYPYLPENWGITHPYAKKITFRHLLAHYAGLKGARAVSFSDAAGLIEYLNGGPDPALNNQGATPDDSIYAYRNQNYSVMRYLIPALWKRLPSAPPELAALSEITDAAATQFFERYISNSILKPAGITNATLNESDNACRVQYYVSKDSTSAGGDCGAADYRSVGGPGLWFMDAESMTTFMKGIMTDDQILPYEARTRLFQYLYVYPLEVPQLDHTTLGYGHGGAWNGSEVEAHGYTVMTLDGLFITIMINSGFLDDDNDNALIESAFSESYSAAWLASSVPTPASTEEPTQVPTISPTNTATPTVTATRTSTPISTRTPTVTPTPTTTQSATSTPVATRTSTPTPTATNTATSTFTPVIDITPTPADALCANGIDEDFDSLTDYPADPGCASKEDQSERDPKGKQCDNDRDDDGDGLADFPEDYGCASASDNTEWNTAGVACDNGIDDDLNGQIDSDDYNCITPYGDSEEPMNTCKTSSLEYLRNSISIRLDAAALKIQEIQNLLPDAHRTLLSRLSGKISAASVDVQLIPQSVIHCLGAEATCSIVKGGIKPAKRIQLRNLTLTAAEQRRQITRLSTYAHASRRTYVKAIFRDAINDIHRARAVARSIPSELRICKAPDDH